MSHDPAQTPNRHFPHLTPTNHRITSPADAAYNCAAWAAGEMNQWWEPRYFWPVADEFGLRKAFEQLGFVRVSKEAITDIGDTVVLYSLGIDDTHIARRLSNGLWTSKLGKWQDIEHDSPEAVAGGVYGEIVDYLWKPNRP